MSNYPPFEEILGFILENVRKSNKSNVALSKLRKDFAKKYGINEKKFFSMTDRYLWGDPSQADPDELSDALAHIFIIATNLLLGTGILTGQSAYKVANDTAIPIGVKEITYEMLVRTGSYNLCLLSFLAEILHESFYYSTEAYKPHSHNAVLDDLTFYFDSINIVCYPEGSSEFLMNLREELVKLFTLAYGNDVKEKSDIKETLVNQLRELSPKGFEKFCLIFLSEILSYNGGNVTVNHLGKSGDGGFDGLITNHNILDGDATYYIQCKRYKKTNIQRAEIQSFIGAMSDKTISANRGVFMTTSKFAKGAHEFSGNSTKQIRLFDIDEIVSLMINKGIGLLPVNSNVQLILDKEFFDQFLE